MRLILYVMGVKTLVREVDESYWGHVGIAMPGSSAGGRDVFREYPDYKVVKKLEYKSVLPEDQKYALDMLVEMSRIHKFDLTVIDVTKESSFRRFWLQEVKGIRAFPTLVSDSGERIEGHITQEQVEALIRFS